MARTGSADLPLHSGRVPDWLAERMARMSRVLVEALVLHYGRHEVLRRLAHPFWFQSLGAVMGMDWHSSGVTTTVLGALKRGLTPGGRQLGLYVVGGKGVQARRVPDELSIIGDRVGIDAPTLLRASRLTARVDSAAVQDGFELYSHSLILADDNAWAVVQQGMNPEARQARRYHWLSEGLSSFVEEPHAAIDGPSQGVIVNLTDKRASRTRAALVELVSQGPDVVTGALRQRLPQPAPRPVTPVLPHLQLPVHEEVTHEDVVLRRLHGTLAAAAEQGPRDFAELLLTPGVGPRTVAALASVAEVLHGTPSRFTDPARFSLAQGGKDRHPFPVRLDIYDETLRVMRAAVDAARLGNDERLQAIRELDRQARRLEAVATGPSFDELVQAGWADAGELLPTDAPPRRFSRSSSAHRARAPRSPPRSQLELPGLSEEGAGEPSAPSG
ncbi:hypothetical protein D187_005385 [Cystobacter fuscus DSM 2262]|uniref:DUF763 domain-containing protein n=1 Tax=Cystobacter fuscus (strain ATCC 25194 / DSM 2262 / NBRC 100088 / M29) TaxID=1242864 RepID=S9PMJ0_CYSF2|nr:DUF763 domain-containing protein [Cystobacter fuscus]EPX64251.1 hypothetical protein D187_005385 [Cystobacter fuscus DSM 2262]